MKSASGSIQRIQGTLRVRTVPTGAFALFPISVLAGLYLVDQLDTVAFGTLTPEIKAAFHLSTAGYGLIVAINFIALFTLALGAGWLGDRSNRVMIVRVGAILAGIGSVFTGLAPIAAALVIFRMVNGAGLVVTNPVHKSLISDYYPARSRGTFFGLHESANNVAGIAGPVLAAGLALLFGWRGVFVLLALPIVALLVVSLRLKEPYRGGTDDAGLARESDAEPPLRLARSVRMLGQIRTFRRIWLALIFIGAGLIPVSSFLSLYFSTVFGVDLLGRGLIGAATGAAGVLGLIVGGRFSDHQIGRHPGRVQAGSGLIFLVVGVGLAVMAFSVNIGLAIGAVVLVGFVFGLFQPMSATVQALVCPPRARGVGFAFGGLFLAAGVLAGATIGGGIADDHGLRWAMVAFIPVLVLGGLILASAARFVAHDAARAAESLAATARLARARRELGAGSLLVCRRVDVAYDGVQVLFGVDCEIREGSIVALLGTNGAGKSTLLKAIVGMAPPQDGMIFFDGHDISGISPAEAAAAGIILMPGGKAVFPTLTVDQNLRLAGWLHRGDMTSLRKRTEEAIGEFPQLLARRNEAAGNLSGGEQQMLALAQTLVSQPRLLMIDELTLGLAPTVVQSLLGIIPKIAASGVTILLVEQSVNLALTLADEAYFMEKGQIRFHGRTADLVNRPDLLRSVFLEGASASARERAQPASQDRRPTRTGGSKLR